MTDTPSHPLSDLVFTPGQSPDYSPEQLAAVARAAGVRDELRPTLGSSGISPLALKLGIVFQEMSAERMVATMPVAGNEQPAGLLHGGAHLVLAETLGSVAAKLHAGAERAVVGIEIGATHHRGIREGLVTGTATAIHLGRTLTTHEVVMTDGQGRRLSTVRMTNMLLDPR